MRADRASATDRPLELLGRMRRARAWVIGDLMLDEYIEGPVHRVSPEAPVPIVSVHGSFQRLGGAAHVAHQIAALGAAVELCGIVGNDSAGDAVLAACRDEAIGTAAVLRGDGRVTVRKVRVLTQHQQLLRMDWEDPRPIDASQAVALLDALWRQPLPDVIVVSDYAKGLLVDDVLHAVIARGRTAGVPVIVDPKRADWSAYEGASLVTPNQGELQSVIGLPVAGDDSAALADAARLLIGRTRVDGIVVTLGARGLMVVPRDGAAELVPATEREVFDVTGAGDTVIATLALALAAGADLVTAARMANTAGGIVVGKVSTAVTSAEELATAATPRWVDKIVTTETLLERLTWWRLQGRTVVFTNGCFDLLHVGHVALLRKASSFGDVLVVAINSDTSVSKLKGPRRPMIPQHERAVMLSALDCVDAVVVFDHDTPQVLIEEVRPEVLVKGADYRPEQIAGRDFIESYGGRVELVPIVEGHSTSRVLERIRAEDADS